jgi:CubicO group peptidase (beta-lactamase class C family)
VGCSTVIGNYNSNKDNYINQTQDTIYKFDKSSLKDNYFRQIEEIFLQNLIKRLMKIGHFPSLSAAIVNDKEILWEGGFGKYDIEKDLYASEDTIYLVASISKTFTATAIMQLYEKGLFDLDDDVNEYLPFILRNPKYPNENITIRMLLAHQSSLATDLPTFFTITMPGDLEIQGYPYPFLKDYLVPQGIHYKPQVWKNYAPGENMYYANIGYALLGYLVEILSESSFEQYCSENIFDPLNMKNTSFELKNLNASNIAVPYDFQIGTYYPYLHYNILDYPAGGLRTSVSDLSRYLIAYMNGGIYEETRILEETSVEEMHSIQYSSDTYDFQYGLGFQIWEKSKDTIIGHTGGLFGVATKMLFRKSDNSGIIFFTNVDLMNLREIAAFSIIEQLLFFIAGRNKNEDFSKSTIQETICTNQYFFNIFKSENKNII